MNLEKDKDLRSGTHHTKESALSLLSIIEQCDTSGFSLTDMLIRLDSQGFKLVNSAIKVEQL